MIDHMMTAALLPTLLRLCTAHLRQQPSLLRQVLAVALQLMMPRVQRTLNQLSRHSLIAPAANGMSAGTAAASAAAVAALRARAAPLADPTWEAYSHFLLTLMCFGKLLWQVKDVWRGPQQAPVSPNI
jgi:hypothetical protein